MDIRTFARSTAPHRRSLAAVLYPVIGPHILSYDKGQLSIEADFSRATRATIQALVDAAPEDSPRLNAKARLDDMTDVERAIILVHLDLINMERQRHDAPAIGPGAFLNMVKNKVDELS